MEVAEEQTSESRVPRPLSIRVIYALAWLTFAVWTLTLILGIVSPEHTTGLAAPGEAPSVWSRHGLALLIMTAISGAIALGIRRERWWTQPLIPFALVLDAVIDGIRGNPPRLPQTVAELSAAVMIAVVLYTWTGPRRYYAEIKLKDTADLSMHP